MIISKNALQVSKVVKVDKSNQILNNVLFEEDGTVVGSNRDIVICVEPVSKVLKEKLILKDIDSDSFLLSQESVDSILRLIPRDTKFQGLLEHINIQKNEDVAQVEIHDGKRKQNLTCKVNEDRYFEYRELFKRINQESGNVRCVVNRKRLSALLTALDSICPDNSDFSPIWLEFTKDNDVQIKVLNPKTKQRVVCAIRGAKGAQNVWLNKNDWEKDITMEEEKSITSIVKKDEKVYNTKTIRTKKQGGPTMYVRQRRNKTKSETNKTETKKTEKKIFVRERRKKSRIVKDAYGKQWAMIPEKCKVCGNHLRTSELGEKTCSYVKCLVYNMLIDD